MTDELVKESSERTVLRPFVRPLLLCAGAGMLVAAMTTMPPGDTHDFEVYSCLLGICLLLVLATVSVAKTVFYHPSIRDWMLNSSFFPLLSVLSVIGVGVVSIVVCICFMSTSQNFTWIHLIVSCIIISSIPAVIGTIGAAVVFNARTIWAAEKRLQLSNFEEPEMPEEPLE